MKQTSTKVFVNETKNNKGGNDGNPLKIEANGKGVGNLPGYNTPYMEEASENTNPMQKHNMVGMNGEGNIVGE